MLAVTCPTCGKVLQIPAEYAGQRGRCNGCKNQIQVPSLSTPPLLSPAQATSPGPATMPQPYAGFWRRVLAYLIDMGVLSLVNVVIVLFVVAPVTTHLDGRIQNEVLPRYQSLLSGLVLYTLPSAAMFLLVWPYFAILESSRLQGTLGKFVVGLQVTNKKGERASFIRANWRYFVKLFSYLTGVGFLMAAVTKRKQALHDVLAGTLVIRTSPEKLLSTKLRGAIALCSLAMPVVIASYSVATSDNGYVAHVKNLAISQVSTESSDTLESSIDSRLQWSAASGITLDSKLVADYVRRVNCTPLDKAFNLMARGPVDWRTDELPASDEYQKTHVIVIASFKDEDSHPITARFLCEKKGDAVLLRDVKIGYDKVKLEAFYKNVYETVAVSYGAKLDELAKDTSLGLVLNQKYRINQMIYATPSAQGFATLMKQASGVPDSAGEVWYTATQSGEAVAIDPDIVVRATSLLPDGNHPDLCEISLIWPPPNALDQNGHTFLRKETKVVYTSKAWLKDNATPESGT